MRIVPVPHGLEDLIGKSGPRSGGLHISSIYNDLYQDLEPARYKRGSTPDPLLLELGLACESWLEDGLRARLGNKGERPGELVGLIDGHEVAYNPDLILFNGVARIGEIKLTWASSKEMPNEPSNHMPPKFEKYTCQMMAYGYLLETPHARLIAYFVNGNYNRVRGGDPQLKAWDFEFTKREMDENWASLISQARHKKWVFEH